MITRLIDRPDGFEIVRDQVAAILATEQANQQALATAAGKDPSPWALNVYQERSNPWEQYLNNQNDLTPIVNVWFDSASYDQGAGGVVDRQCSDAIINIDCYGCGVSTDDGDDNTAGDTAAALNAQRALRLVRNIIMASEYTYLDLRGFVGGRMPQSIKAFQPQTSAPTVQQIVATRLALKVRHNEFSPQYEYETLETLAATVKRSGDGRILIQTEYQ
ncbi:MAG: hypothetical protein GY767_22675 [Shimia sp.]|nr:hypothetical protein [Shimia sp.]